MAGSSNPREIASASGSTPSSAAFGATQLDTRILWMSRDAAPDGVAQLLAHAGHKLCPRSEPHWPAQRVAWLAQVSAAARAHRSLSGRRIAVIHPDPGAADALAEALRARSAQVVVLSLGEAGLDRAEALDPEVIVMQPDHLAGSGLEVLQSLFRHARLRWVPILLVPHARLGIAGASAPNVRDLSIGINLLCGEYEALVGRARRQQPFELSLHELGPMRTLRALIESTSVLRVRIETDALSIEVDLGEGILIGAQGGARHSPDQQSLLGVHAIAALQTQVSGHVSVWPVAHPAVTNIMAPLEAMLLGQHAAPVLADTASTRLSTVRSVFDDDEGADDSFDRPTNQRAVPAGLRASPANQNTQVVPQPLEASSVVKQTKAHSPSTLPAPALPSRAFAVSLLKPRMSSALPPPAPTLLAAFASELPAPPKTAAPPAPPEPTEIMFEEQPALDMRAVPPPTPPARASVAKPPAAPVDPWPLMVEAVDTVSQLELDGPTPDVRTRKPVRALIAALVLASATAAGVFWWQARHQISPANASVATVEASRHPMPASAEPIEAPAPLPTAEPSVATNPELLPPAAEPESLLALDAGIAPSDSPATRAAQLREASRLVARGHRLKRDGKYEQARAAYSAAAHAYRRYPRAVAGLAEAYLALGDRARALEAARAVVAERPRFADDHRLLGDAYRLNERMPEALAAFRHAAALGSRTARERLKALL